jgi:hypothetical protein
MSDYLHMVGEIYRTFKASLGPSPLLNCNPDSLFVSIKRKYPRH